MTILANTGFLRLGRWTAQVYLEWKLPDLWIGCFWMRCEGMLNIWICLLPCLPVHIKIVSK